VFFNLRLTYHIRLAHTPHFTPEEMDINYGEIQSTMCANQSRLARCHANIYVVGQGPNPIQGMGCFGVYSLTFQHMFSVEQSILQNNIMTKT